VKVLTEEERVLLEQNQRVKALNRAPADFPAFLRKGYEVTVLADGYVYRDDGLIYKDFEAGTGADPQPGQQVEFDYTAYNESGGTIDSSFRQGRPASTRLGIGGMIPGFELGLAGMRVGGRRRIIVPPELGPPVGPSTFFSARQFEVFDVTMLSIKSCERTQSGMFSTVQCK
jgi:FKBP-type peptidyl-prolyl cis-trans isomerase